MQLSDSELDELFKKAAEGDPIPVNPEAWRKMEAKLDAQKRRRFWRWLSFGLFGSLLVGGLLWWQWPREQPNPGLATEQVNPSQSVDGQIIEPGKTTQPETQGQPTVPQAQENTGASAEQKNREEPLAQANVTDGKARAAVKGQTQTERSKTEVPGKEVVKSSKANAQGRRRVGNPPTIDQLNKPVVQISQPLFVNKGGAEKPGTEAPPARELTGQLATLAPKLLPVYPATDPQTLAQRLSDPVPGRLILSDEWPPRFNLGLGISPDVSFVEMSALTRPGYKLALEAELRLARRLSLASGVVYTQMRYQTDPEDYRAPYYGFWPQGSKPWGMASGDCQVIEVPINLRYALLAQPRQRFFVGAGVSSYFLLKEDYRFSMLNQTNQRQWNWHWGVENQNRHWFGILNLSAGYTRQLTGRWAVQAEPFIKLPLANGVGAGQLGLRSTGVFFSLRYQLLR